MRSFTPFAICSTLLLFSRALADQANIPAVKDSTIFASTQSCPDCPENVCNKCTKGLEDKLQANTGGHAYIRSLVGFKLPNGVKPLQATECSVQFPAFVKLPEYGLNMTVVPALTSDWDEATVDAENAPQSGTEVTHVPIPALTNPPSLDVTNACQSAAEDGQFSIYIGADAVAYYEIWSKDSGNPAILHVTYNSE